MSVVSPQGLLGGLAAGSSTVLFPNNPLLTDYGINSDKLFKINLKAYQPLPIRLRPNNNRVDYIHQTGANMKIAEFDVVYSGDSFSVSHTHHWDESFFGGAAQALSKSIGDVLPGGLAGFASTAASILQGETAFHTRSDTFGDIDVAPVYKGSGEQQIEISFVLLTHSDPINEVVLPAQLLTYLTYPKIDNDQTLNKLITKSEAFTDTVVKGAGKILKTGVNAISQAFSKDPPAEAGDRAKEKVDTKLTRGLVDHIKSFLRYRVGIAPPVWVITCSNGSQFLGNAHCKSITVEYHGPWLGAPETPSFAAAAKSFVNSSGLPSILSTIFPSAGILSDFGINDILTGSNKGGYPSYATINMTFQSNHKLMFGEEWLLSLGGDRLNKIKVGAVGEVVKRASPTDLEGSG